MIPRYVSWLGSGYGLITFYLLIIFSKYSCHLLTQPISNKEKSE